MPQIIFSRLVADQDSYRSCLRRVYIVGSLFFSWTFFFFAGLSLLLQSKEVFYFRSGPCCSPPPFLLSLQLLGVFFLSFYLLFMLYIPFKFLLNPHVLLSFLGSTFLFLVSCYFHLLSPITNSDNKSSHENLSRDQGS